MKNLFKIVLSASIVLLITSCNQNSPAPATSTPSTPAPQNTTLNVFSTFLCNGQQLGASAAISTNSITSWSLTKGQKDLISLCFTSPADGQVYSGFLINSPNGTTLQLGSNTNCTLQLMNGNNIYSCSTLTVNLTHIATAVNDTYEGTFSGNVKLTVSSPFSMNTYPASGSFKVPLK
jgi:hypothetical protein